jgi:cob(I)alamin adenosyltransferase
MGLIYLFTGNGKGKTTSAIGNVIRAVGYGHKVVFIQFMKGMPSSEVEVLKKLGVEVYRFGRNQLVNLENPKEVDKKLASEGLKKAEEVIKGEPFLVVLDEINVAVAAGLISIKDVLQLLDKVPEKTHIILTGRYAKKELIEKADLVTEMCEVKHPFNKGIPAVKGLDY